MRRVVRGLTPSAASLVHRVAAGASPRVPAAAIKVAHPHQAVEEELGALTLVRAQEAAELRVDLDGRHRLLFRLRRRRDRCSLDALDGLAVGRWHGRRALGIGHRRVAVALIVSLRRRLPQDERLVVKVIGLLLLALWHWHRQRETRRRPSAPGLCHSEALASAVRIEELHLCRVLRGQPEIAIDVGRAQLALHALLKRVL